MSRNRYILVNTLISYILGFSLFCIFAQEESWPFSHFPMYAKVYGTEFSRLRFYGITEDSEVRLDNSKYWHGLSTTNIDRVLPKIESDPERFIAALEHLKKAYFLAREAGAHSGPDIKGIRFYRCYWNLSLKDTRKKHDCHKLEFRYEYMFAEGG